MKQTCKNCGDYKCVCPRCSFNFLEDELITKQRVRDAINKHEAIDKFEVDWDGLRKDLGVD